MTLHHELFNSNCVLVTSTKWTDEIVFLFVPLMFKNLSEAVLWAKVRPVLKNGKTGLAGLLYFILSDKNLGEN